ncbi:hypothetical protein SGUI_0765 [Serinicoccus hydrothermalis]|uniref:Uncharacterized protein n=1 Tax=Serinicoccus hydrothermalis TaxID=1758689 RepID=A0A1B1N9S7_9MICO|nr:hypothetical protein SGUI_0765 [Serinicoccus hydrothermalis]
MRPAPGVTTRIPAPHPRRIGAAARILTAYPCHEARHRL